MSCFIKFNRMLLRYFKMIPQNFSPSSIVSWHLVSFFSICMHSSFIHSSSEPSVQSSIPSQRLYAGICALSKSFLAYLVSDIKPKLHRKNPSWQNFARLIFWLSLNPCSTLSSLFSFANGCKPVWFLMYPRYQLMMK